MEKKLTEEVKETVKETAAAAKKTAKTAKTTATAKAKEAKTTATAKAKEAKETASTKAKEASTTAKATAKTVKKSASETAKTVKKAAKKEYTKLALKETYVQAGGNEYKQSEILEKVEKSFIEAGNKITAMKTLQLYIKPEDGAAYYVVNGEITGKVEL